MTTLSKVPTYPQKEVAKRQLRCLWDPADDALGITPEDRKIVIRARAKDWNYVGPGMTPEPPEAQAIFDKALALALTGKDAGR